MTCLQQKEQTWIQEKAALSAALSTQQQLWLQLSDKNAISSQARYVKGEYVIVIAPNMRYMIELASLSAA